MTAARRGWMSLALGVALAAACAAPPPQPSGPVTIRAPLLAAPVSLTFIGKGGDTSGEVFAYQVTDSLVQFDDNLVLVPRLAARWEMSPDRKDVTFHLRRDVRWHDGEPFTADDVLYTVAMVRESAVENRSFGGKFKDVEVQKLDDFTVQASYAAPTADFLESWRLPMLPEHLAGAEARPGDGSAGALLEGAFARHPVGCGPFRFVRYEPDVELVLEANDDYWDGRPGIDRLVLKIFKDQQTAYQALQRGDLELLVATPTQWNETREADGGRRFASFVYYRLVLWQITWRVDGSNPFFDDARVRRAMTLALDREAFSRAIEHGLLRPGITAIHPDTPWSDPGIEPWPYDPAEAGRLLEAAGWVDRDGDGVRERDGVPFRFTLLTAGTSATVDQMTAWQQQSWQAVGVASDIRKLEWQAFVKERNERGFHAAAFNLTFSGVPDDLYDLHHSASRAQGWNFSGLADAETDRLIEEGRTTFEVEARGEIYRRLQQRLHELEPISCLFHFPTPVLHDRRLEGVARSPLDFWRTTHGPRVWRWAGES